LERQRHWLYLYVWYEFNFRHMFQKSFFSACCCASGLNVGFGGFAGAVGVVAITFGALAVDDITGVIVTV
jgi:hypothetical protein